MTAKDRAAGWCVATSVLFVYLTACGGKAAPQATTPPPQPQPTAGAGQPLPEGQPGYQDVKPEAAPPLREGETALPGPKPATLDLPAEKRAAIVASEITKADQALRNRDADGAVRAARAALDADESNAGAMLRLAHGYYLKGYDDKVEAVLTIAKKRPEGDQNPILWMLLGLVYDRNNREDEALAAYEKATALKPDYLGALHNKGTIYLKRKRYADAVTAYERLVSLQSQSPRAHTYLGAAYRGRSADEPQQREVLLRKAEAELRMAMTINPAYAPAYFNMGIPYLDADPFPGLEGLPRMQNAQKYLAEYKQKAGPSGVVQADDYLVAAQKGIEREQKALERKKKKDAQPPKKKAGEQ
jgi:tetratricopeptide (TPR) repeat protein